MDEKYAVKFEALAEAIWAKAPNMIPVVGGFVYGKRIQDPFNFYGAASRITSLAGMVDKYKTGLQCIGISTDQVAEPSHVSAAIFVNSCRE